jgi:hypothetical protein
VGLEDDFFKDVHLSLQGIDHLHTHQVVIVEVKPVPNELVVEQAVVFNLHIDDFKDVAAVLVKADLLVDILRVGLRRADIAVVEAHAVVVELAVLELLFSYIHFVLHCLLDELSILLLIISDNGAHNIVQ